MIESKGTYGTYIDINKKTQTIDSLPVTFQAKTINALFPGCIPKPYFNPQNKAPIICNKGMFTISGQQNSDGGFITIDNVIAGKFSATSPNLSTNTDYSVTLKEASEEEYKNAQKKINGN